MNDDSTPAGAIPEKLDRISTRWSAVHDPNHFLIRYADAVLGYLNALLRNAQDAEDVSQEFFVRVVERGFERAHPDRGRFRDYLKTAVRNAATSHLRRLQRSPALVDPSQIESVLPAESDSEADREWVADWQRCLMDRAWRALESHQHRSPGNLYWTVLRVSVDHGDEDSTSLATRAAAIAGRPLRADAFRQQLSRARRMFAELLLREVAQTLEDPTPVEIEEELVETGLIQHVKPFLPEPR